MSWFKDVFLSKPAPQQRVVEARAPIINLKKETGGQFRNGMWVTLKSDPPRTGILTVANELGIAAVMLTQEDGTNLLQISAPLSELRQATWREIPEARRPLADYADRLGYDITPKD